MLCLLLLMAPHCPAALCKMHAALNEMHAALQSIKSGTYKDALAELDPNAITPGW